MDARFSITEELLDLKAIHATSTTGQDSGNGCFGKKMGHVADYCIIHQEHLCGKPLDMEHVMKVVTKRVNLIYFTQLESHRLLEENCDVT